MQYTRHQFDETKKKNFNSASFIEIGIEFLFLSSPYFAQHFFVCLSVSHMTFVNKQIFSAVLLMTTSSHRFFFGRINLFLYQFNTFL